VRCQVRVEEVLGYGSATPPLSTGEQTTGLASSVLADPDVAALAPLGTRTLVLKYAGDRPNLGDQPDRETSPKWTIQLIE